MRRVRPYGPAAFLLECDDPDEAVALHLELRASPPDGVVQTIPGAASLLVECASREAALSASRDLAVREVQSVQHPSVEHLVEVRYDGPDLVTVAARAGLGVDEVIARHTSSVCTVALTGFAPGFAYLRGLDPVLATPRLASPRASVPAGSVAIGGPWTGVYPRRGPGGWNVIGTTSAVLWDLSLPSPAVLSLGDTVRFRAV